MWRLLVALLSLGGGGVQRAATQASGGIKVAIKVTKPHSLISEWVSVVPWEVEDTGWKSKFKGTSPITKSFGDEVELVCEYDRRMARTGAPLVMFYKLPTKRDPSLKEGFLPYIEDVTKGPRTAFSYEPLSTVAPHCIFCTRREQERHNAFLWTYDNPSISYLPTKVDAGYPGAQGGTGTIKAKFTVTGSVDFYCLQGREEGDDIQIFAAHSKTAVRVDPRATVNLLIDPYARYRGESVLSSLHQNAPAQQYTLTPTLGSRWKYECNYSLPEVAKGNDMVFVYKVFAADTLDPEMTSRLTSTIAFIAKVDLYGNMADPVRTDYVPESLDVDHCMDCKTATIHYSYDGYFSIIAPKTTPKHKADYWCLQGFEYNDELRVTDVVNVTSVVPRVVLD